MKSLNTGNSLTVERSSFSTREARETPVRSGLDDPLVIYILFSPFFNGLFFFVQKGEICVTRKAWLSIC